MDPETTQEPVPGDDNLTMSGLVALLATEREASDKKWKAELDTLRQPDRSNVPDLANDSESRMETETDAERTALSMVSLYQPTDSLYERLFRQHPEMRMWRSAEQDEWGREFLLGMAGKDSAKRLTARAKLAEATARAIQRHTYGRATSLEGLLDVSDPTAIMQGDAAHLLPQNMTALVQIARDAVAALPPRLMQLQMTSGNVRVPTSGAATAAMVAEGGTPSQGEPPFTSEMMQAHKAVAFMKGSEELIADSAFNVISIFGQRGGSALGALSDVQIATSNGTAPNISEALSGVNVDEATTTVLIYEDLVTLFMALAQVYRTGATWAANAVTITLMSQLMDGNDHPILSFPGVVAPVGSGPGGVPIPGVVGSIFGRPVIEAPFADGTLIFGNLELGYGFARREGIVAKSSSDAEFAEGLVQFKFEERYDGRIIDTVAIVQMSSLATVA